MVGKCIDMEALSPRDANAQRPQRVNDLKAKATAQLKASKEKEHPPPPPEYVTEPPSSDCKDGIVYKIGKALGKGGFAICYEGFPMGTRKKFALKIVKSRMPAKIEQKFQTELQIHSKMRQQNIVQFLRAFSFESSTYLVLELCPNGSLMDMVKRRKGVTEAEVRFYAVQIAGAIKYMHAKGIIHRDLKMGNIFLDKHMNAKIGDFGLAALLVTGKDMQTIRRTTLCGTPNYIAPEILEKGRKGHDHMVDIWSLGIIMYAMLTSKPPFQSTTTDEIYRRAKTREYEWPEIAGKIWSDEIKAVVDTMLQDADIRPCPDDIVQHTFFLAGYMPVPADMTPLLREVPPEKSRFNNYPRTDSEEIQNLLNLKDMCRSCGVGPWNETKVVHKPVWKEMAAEEQAGLTPVIPLAEDVVYRPFDDWLRENRLQNRYALSSEPRVQPDGQLAAAPPQPSLSDAAGASLLPQTSASAVPRGAPRQSFAAQQRAQGRPAMPRVQEPNEGPATRQGTVARSTRSRREVTAPATVPATVPVTVTAAAPEATDAVTLALAGLSVQGCEQAGKSLRSGTAGRAARTKLPSSRTEPVARRAVDAEPAAGLAKPVSIRREDARSEAAAAAATGASSRGEWGSLFSPDELQEQVPGTRPDSVLERLRKLQAELERALNSRSTALLSARDRTPSLPQIVVKWVDYTNKFGLGYILSDGSIGCILRDMAAHDGPGRKANLPPACLLVHDAERHIRRKGDASYPDRHQIVPMREGIYFYENYGEDGLARVRVEPASFRVPVGPDGVAGKLSAGRDVFEHRKRERVVLWKKFANYMLAYGRELEPEAGAGEPPALPAAPTLRDPTAPPADLVTFYQRFGDVGCWVFSDGHMQFNFPDHTKVVLDAAGTWCHFWHLPQDAAERLAATGSLDEASLDERAVLSYPLQTLLNFSVQSKATMRSAAGGVFGGSTTSSRRYRPEISPDLQGIPAANDFRRKVDFIRSVVREWVANGGIGNSDMSPDGRLRWMGHRETKNVAAVSSKHVWVTIGARGGDTRFVANFDPRRPHVVFPDHPQ